MPIVWMPYICVRFLCVWGVGVPIVRGGEDFGQQFEIQEVGKIGSAR